MTDEEIRGLFAGLDPTSGPAKLLVAMMAAEITTDDLYLLDILAAAKRAGTEHEEHLGKDPVCAVCGNLQAGGPMPNFYWHPLCAMDYGRFPAGPVSIGNA